MLTANLRLCGCHRAPYGRNKASEGTRILAEQQAGLAFGSGLTLELFESPFQLVVVVRHLPGVGRRQRPGNAGRPLQFHYARPNVQASCTVESRSGPLIPPFNSKQLPRLRSRERARPQASRIPVCRKWVQGDLIGSWLQSPP